MSKENITQLSTAEYQKIIKENNDLQNKVNELNVKIGELRNELFTIRDSEDKEAKPEKILVKTITLKPDGWGGYRTTEKVESTVGLDDVKNQLKEQVAKDLEVDIPALRKENSKLKLQITDLQNSIEVLKKERDTEIAHILKLERNQMKREKEDMVIRHKEHLERKDDYIKDLKKELERERANKTDRELMEKRNKEIKVLKERIHELEARVAHLRNAGFFTRLLDRIGNYHTRKQAMKDEARRVKEVENVKKIDNNGTSNFWDRYFKAVSTST